MRRRSLQQPIRPLFAQDGKKQVVEQAASEVVETEAAEVGEEVEEARQPRIKRDPAQPTKAEKEEHDLFHIPYRSWCPACVIGKVVNSPHDRKEEDEEKAARTEEVPRIVMDYFYMGSAYKGLGKEQEEEKGSRVAPYLAVFDESTGNGFAYDVQKTGVEEWIVLAVVDDLQAIVYDTGELILKSDQEPAIVALGDSIAAARGGKTIREFSAVGEHQSNGRVERYIRTLQGQVRTNRCALQGKLKKEVSADKPIQSWLLRWTAMSFNRYAVGRDGRTAYERLKGRRCAQTIAAFAEKVLYKNLLEAKEKDHKMDTDWQYGLWLGHNMKTNESLIGTDREV